MLWGCRRSQALALRTALWPPLAKNAKSGAPHFVFYAVVLAAGGGRPAPDSPHEAKASSLRFFRRSSRRDNPLT
jgi:hypothetical protein